MENVFLRLVDRGMIQGVPVVSVYLLRENGGAEECLLSSSGGSPATADMLASGLGELGIRVERVSRPFPDVEELKEKKDSLSGAKASRRMSKQRERVT